MKIQNKIRKSRLWAFDGKNYQALDNQRELSAYPKKQPRTFALKSGTPYRNYGKRNLIISANGMIDDSNNYVNPASRNKMWNSSKAHHPTWVPKKEPANQKN